MLGPSEIVGKMGVNIDHARENPAVACVHREAVVAGEVRAYFSNAAIGDPDVSFELPLNSSKGTSCYHRVHSFAPVPSVSSAVGSPYDRAQTQSIAYCDIR